MGYGYLSVHFFLLYLYSVIKAPQWYAAQEGDATIYHIDSWPGQIIISLTLMQFIFRYQPIQQVEN